MQTKEWRWVDKREWGEGPWQGEPDKLQWIDKTTGLPCLIVRNDWLSGSLCGYVGVPRSHPRYGQTDHDDLDVHGGVTFVGPCMEDKDHGVCHIVDPGEDDDIWWIGFDTAHFMDCSPMMEAREHRIMPKRLKPRHGSDGKDQFGFAHVYCTVKYVRKECKSLAKQLKEMQQ